MPTTPAAPRGRLVIVRHGKTEWSETGRHTGLTDVPLTVAGEEQARRIGPLLSGLELRPALVLCSPLARARRTAELAGYPDPELEGGLLEWDYGGYEGRTTDEIRDEVGYTWTAFEHGVPAGQTPGETVEEVAARASRVLRRVGPVLEERDALLFGHGHALRILTSVFLREPPRFGAKILLDAGSVSMLVHEHDTPAIQGWNRTPD